MMRVNAEETRKREFLDHRSHVHNNGHIYLFGRDVQIVRLRIYERDKGICQLRLANCKGFADWDSGGEMHHLNGGLGLQRCWCDHNLAWVCFSCHRNNHVRVKWGTRIPAQKAS